MVRTRINKVVHVDICVHYHTCTAVHVQRGNVVRKYNILSLSKVQLLPEVIFSYLPTASYTVVRVRVGDTAD